MSATTCTLNRRGEVDDLTGPWQTLLGRAGMLESFLRDGVTALVPATADEDFRRAMVIALSDGTAGTEHAIDLPGVGRRWFAWSLTKRSDGRLDGVVVDATRARAGSVWNVASEIAPRLVGAAPDLPRAAAVLLDCVARELAGEARLHHTGPYRSPSTARAAHAGRGAVDWHPTDRGGRCEVAVPVAWPSTGTAVLTITTPYRLDLWLDEIHLETLGRSLGGALGEVERTAAGVAALARERHFTETLAHELKRPLRLLHRTLEEAGRVTDEDQRAYLLERATQIGARLGRLTDMVTAAALDQPTGRPGTQPLAEVLAEALGDRVRGSVPTDVQVLADRALLVRTLTLAAEVVAPDAPVRLDATAGDDSVLLHVHPAPVDGAPLGARPPEVGQLLVERVTAAAGGRATWCHATTAQACTHEQSGGVQLTLPRPGRAPRPRG